MSSYRDPTLIFKQAIPLKAAWTDGELKIHLQQAVTLELTTIPLYLYAMFSLNVSPGADPKTDPTAKAYAQILQVAGEEMLHLGLVGNILKSVGGSPILSSESYIPKYPNAIFKQGVMLNLRSAKNNMQTFARIEKPGFMDDPDNNDSGQLDEYETIGAFYDAVRKGLQSHPPSFAPSTANQLDKDTWHTWLRGEMIQVSDLSSAFAALDIIVEQGEGHFKHVEGSHYEIFHDLTKITSKIICYPVVENPATHSYKGEKLYEVALTFDAAYCYLLKTIEALWNISDLSKRKALLANFKPLMGPILSGLGRFLVQEPLLDHRTAAPCFEYYDLGPDPHARIISQMKAAIENYSDDEGKKSMLAPIATAIEGLTPLANEQATRDPDIIGDKYYYITNVGTGQWLLWNTSNLSSGAKNSTWWIKYPDSGPEVIISYMSSNHYFVRSGDHVTYTSDIAAANRWTLERDLDANGLPCIYIHLANEPNTVLSGTTKDIDGVPVLTLATRVKGHSNHQWKHHAS